MIRSWLLVWTFALFLAACGDDSTTDAGDAGGDSAMDAPMDAMIPDSAERCETDEQCDDAIPCTTDACLPAGFCRHTPDNAFCSNDIFCDGVEICDVRAGGCRMGDPNACNDDDVCTLDRCDEESKTCVQVPRDFDEDGAVDWHCEGGTDCDDRNPNLSPLTNEVCDDMLDNDCDGMVDESGCGRAPYDTCDDPFDVSAGGRFFISNEGAMADYGLSCAGTRRDVVLTFTTTEEHDVSIRADGAGVTAVSLRTTCDDTVSELECESGFPGQARVRSLPAGTYFAIVSDSGVGEIEVQVDFLPPTDPPTNQTCASPEDITGGGTFMGSFLDVSDDLMMSCGFSGQADLVYSFTTTETQDVRVNLVSDTSDTMNFAIRSTCSDDASTLRCSRGAPAGSTVHELPAGSYYLIIEGPSFREVDYTLDVEFLAPTPAAEGDVCASAIPLTLGTMELGTLSDKEDDIDVSCGFYYRDAVYSFTTTSRQDVTVTVDGGGTYMYVAVQGTCGDDSTQLRCTSGNPSRARLRDLAPGTYYVIVESFRGTSFNITVDATAPTMVTPVTGNDDCASAYTVPPTGGLFTGNTSGLMNDYETSLCGAMARAPDAAFSLTLTTPKRVVANTDGSSFDTVLHVHEPMCVSMSERYCDDDGGDGSASLIDQMLTAGTWYFVVDGFGTASAGDYTFEVQVFDP